jgi:hypothetical protein
VLKLEVQDFEDRLQWVVGSLLARNFNETETGITRRSFDELLKYYQSHTKQAEELVKVGELPTDEKLPVAELAAWTMVVNQLLNLDETLNK